MPGRDNAEEFSANVFEKEGVPEFLVYAPSIEPTLLISKIVVHPDASDEFRDNVNGICQEHGLPTPERSRRLDEARF
jgi:hypothetical protein